MTLHLRLRLHLHTHTHTHVRTHAHIYTHTQSTRIHSTHTNMRSTPVPYTHTHAVYTHIHENISLLAILEFITLFFLFRFLLCMFMYYAQRFGIDLIIPWILRPQFQPHKFNSFIAKRIKRAINSSTPSQGVTPFIALPKPSRETEPDSRPMWRRVEPTQFPLLAWCLFPTSKCLLGTRL